MGELVDTARAALAEAETQEATEAAKAAAAVEKERVAKLTPEERAAEKKAKAEAEERRKMQVDPTESQKKTTVGLILGESDVDYVEVGEANARERRLLLRNKNWEHATEDRFGRWLYRRM